eukprot:CAMPEP_0118914828 /NCGR_PEP_ID=MMETSP1166-20130328/15126_1 /TAXON_ID=1104430 /ORGANISM="Chrysoreinhardia sp, Strain CCMP3193" /LENGTH=425 /DNA_ID=CAMNT_0006854457 /DNA_START=3 /DNA_END=1280 /DNA_ORIENTATION=+
MISLIIVFGVAEGLKVPAYSRRCVLTRAAVLDLPPTEKVEKVETWKSSRTKSTDKSSVPARPATKGRPSTRSTPPPIDFERVLDLVLLEPVPTDFLLLVNIVCTLLAAASVAPWIMVGVAATTLAVNVGRGVRNLRIEHREKPEEKLKKKLEPFSDVPLIYGPEYLVQAVESYYFDVASKTDFLVLTNATPEQSSGTAEVFGKLRSNEMFLLSGKKVFAVSMNKESLEDQLKQDLGNDVTLTKVGELAKAESAVVVILVASAFTEDVVARVFLETAAVKRGGGAALDVIVCVPKADQLPTTLPAAARLDRATSDERRAAEEAERAAEEAERAAAAAARELVDAAAAANDEAAFFLVLKVRAKDLGLSDDVRKYLAVVKGLIKANDAAALEEAREILGAYIASSKDDAAQLAALQAFADFGFAMKK